MDGGGGSGRPHRIEINQIEDFNEDGAVDMGDVDWLLKHKANTRTPLQGDGDFRSAECVALLEEADIVVTNPPFSLFRAYVAQLFEYDKEFLIIGNANAVAYKEIFPHVKDNKIWLGVDSEKSKWFGIPPTSDYEPGDYCMDKQGNKFIQLGFARWFTNLEHKKRREELVLYKKYTPAEYPKYDDYNAININKVKNIPMDYEGAMGVPISFMDKYNPDQFEIVGLDRYVEDNPNPGHRFKLNGKETYARVLVKHKR